MDAIKTVELTKRYKDVVAVDRLNLQVKSGELFALLGMNGAGKTTAIRMLSCITQPTEGDGFVCGHSIVKDSSSVRGVIGVSPQETAVAPNLSVRENLELICGIYGFSKGKRLTKIDEITQKLNLGDVMNRRAGSLSGGWQRRVSIAMALISEPSVLFLDEPTLGLDVISRAELWSIIKKLKNSATVVLTTHYLEEVEALADRVGIMHKGRLLFTGRIDELKQITSADRLEDGFLYIIKEAEI